MNKKFALLFFMAMLVFAFSGCGGSSSNQFVPKNNVPVIDSRDIEPENPIVKSEDKTPDIPVVDSDDSRPTPPVESDDSRPTPPVESDDSRPAPPVDSDDSRPAPPVDSDDSRPAPLVESDDNRPTPPIESDDSKPTPPVDSGDKTPDTPTVESDDNTSDTPVIESNDNTPEEPADDDTDTGDYLTSDDIEVQRELSDSGNGTHVIEANGETVSYSNLRITKTGDSSGENADFYGENSAVFATNGATLTLTDSLIVTDGGHANAVFSYGSGTTVNVEDCVIITHDNNSGGIMTTGGGTMNAKNLTIETEGGSSAAIRSDRGGGTVNVTGGSYTSSGRGSPAIYSTADITVKNAHLESKTAQGIVIEGKNSVTLTDCDVVANNVTHNSNKSTHYQAVMIYQSGSGDASEGKGEFTMTGGTLTNQNEDIFFINNTIADITLNDADIINNGGVFMRAEAAGWGSSGSNGGKVNLYANDQLIRDDIVVDNISILNMYLKDNSSFVGALNTANSEGQIYVEISGSTWTLTGDSYVTSLTCEADSINLNGHSLYVNGTAYESGSSSTGSAIEISSGSSDNSRPTPPGR